MTLPVLALVDATSVGTLLLPAWLLLAPQVRPRAVIGYLALVAGAYWLLGLALLVGAEGVAALVDGAGDGADRSRALLVAQLFLGVALLVWALWPDRLRRGGRDGGRSRATTVEASGDPGQAGARTSRAPQPGRLARWRNRAAGGQARGGLLVLAAVAVLLEAATMLPYLGAVALLASTGLSTGTQVLALAGYCLLMVTPALLLVAGRVLAARRVEPLLVRLDGWSRRAGGEAVLWVAGIAGFLLGRDAATAFGLL